MSSEDRIQSPYREWKAPNTQSKCTYHEAKNKSDSPHKHVTPNGTKLKILPNILHHIGNTPLVRLDKLRQSEGLECDLLAKCEYFNAAGSVKDRIAKRMVEDAEMKGILKPGDTIIEATSGNTGIGLALVAAVKGYRCILTMPERMSSEKVDMLIALGAEIVRTPSAAAYDSPESHVGVARRLMEELPNSHLLDQYRNVNNALAHYDTTAEEILADCDGKLDMVVVATGTGGSLTGIARKIKEACPSCKVIAVDPEGSIMAQPDSLNAIGVKPFQVEGIGYDFVPTICDRKVVDEWYKCNDKSSLLMARRMIREEGLLCGGSSGCSMSCAIRAAKDYGLKKGQKCVVLLPDSIRNYMTKHLSENWMIAQGFIDPHTELDNPQKWWWSVPVSAMSLTQPLTIRPEMTIRNTLELLKKEGEYQVTVLDDTGRIHGIVTLQHIMTETVKGKVALMDTVSKVTRKEFKQLPTSTTLYQLSKIIEIDNFALIVREPSKDITKKNGVCDKGAIIGMVTHMDVVNFILSHAPQPGTAKGIPHISVASGGRLVRTAAF